MNKVTCDNMIRLQNDIFGEIMLKYIGINEQTVAHDNTNFIFCGLKPNRRFFS